MRLRIIFLLTLVGLEANAQKLEGCYSQQLGPIAESAARYHFLPENTFIYEMWDDTGDRFGKGKYHLKGDSIYLHFHSIPDSLKTIRIIKQPVVDSVSTLQVINVMNASETWACSYQILNGQEVIETGYSDVLGRVYFSLKPGQTLRINGYPSKSESIYNCPFSIEFNPGVQNYQYVIFTSGLRSYTWLKPAKAEVYAIKRYPAKGKFKIMGYNDWIWFKACEN